MRRTSWIILTLLISLGLTPIPTAAQSVPPTMHVTVGFDGYCHDSGWCPVYVVLSNEGADIEAELRVVTRSNDETYARRVMLPAHSRKGYFIHVPSDNSASRLTVQLYVGDNLLASQQATVSWLGAQDRLYGIASDAPSALNFLSDVAPVSGDAKVAHLNLETLPGDPLGWEGLDVLVLNDVDTTVLSSEQRQALETWVLHGGHLIVGGGAGAPRTAAGVADLLPVTLGGTRMVDDLGELSKWVDAPVAPGPYAVAEAILRDGEVLIEQDDLILLARRAYGDGYMNFVAFDAGLNPFTRWDANSRLWDDIVGKQVVGSRGLPVRDGSSARDAVASIPGMHAPSTWQIVAFMLVYTLLVGPINYVVLRKLERRELAWLTIPVLIAGFTACAYLTGFQIRGTQVIVHSLAGVYVPPGAEIGRVEQVVGVFSPRRARYDLLATGAEVRDMPYYYDAETRPLHLWEEVNGTRISDLRINVGEGQSFIAGGYVDVSPVDSDLRLVGSDTGALRLEGTVHNSSLPLQDAVILIGTQTQILGDLDAGQDIAVSLALPGTTGTSYYDLASAIMGAAGYWDDPVLYRRYAFLRAIFSRQTPDSPDLLIGGYLVGWVDDDAPLPVKVMTYPYSTVGVSLYVYELPVAGKTEGQITIGPDLITRQMENSTGYVDAQSPGCHLEPGAEVELRFTVWPGVTLKRADELVIDMQGNAYGEPITPPALALWNWESGEWDEFDLTWGRHSIPSAENYVLPPGHVLLRLTADSEWPVDLNSLTITLKGQN